MEAPAAPAYAELPTGVPKVDAVANGLGETPSYATASNPQSGVATKFKTGFLSKSCLAIHTNNAALTFLHPVGAGPTDPIPETTVNGYVVLQLTTPRQIKSFTVTLLGVEDTDFPIAGRESHTFLEQELTLPLSLGGDAELPAGTYPFPFRFTVPGTLAPHVQGRHGRARTKVVAKAKGAGILGGTVQAEQPIDFSANPGWADPQKDLRLDIQFEDFSKDIGPYRLHFHSALFVVSGLMSIRFKLPAPPQTLNIISVRVSIEQTWNLISSKMKNKVTGEPYFERPKPDEILFALVDSKHQPDEFGARCNDGTPFRRLSEDSTGKRTESLATLERGESWEMTHMARLPCDDTVSPTTHANTLSKLRLSHMLIFEMIYRNQAGIKREFIIRQSVPLNSCCCILPSVLLPSYESSDPSPQNADFQRILSSGVCLCGSSFGDLKKTQDPTKYLDGPLEPSVVVPIKAAEARAGLSRGVQY